MTNKACFTAVMRWVGLISLLSVIASYISQYSFDLIPCHLCLYQRYAMIIITALAVLFYCTRTCTFKTLLTVATLFFLNAGIAGYQVLIEKKIIELPDACQKTAMTGQSFDAFKDQLLSQPTVSCDQVQFALWGISMAGYNFLLCCAVGLMIVYVLVTRRVE